MLVIEVSNFKYGSYVDVDSCEFKNKQEVNSFINELREFTQETQEEEKRFGESLCKWTCRFSFNGVDYNFYQDC
tara:strand:- start:222 stop:443 length:222 start_codon:yes stop_codon:yes gene_type:complete